MTDLNLKLDPVETLIFDGLASSLQRVTSALIVWTTSSDTIQVVKRVFGNNKVKYPYGSLRLTSWTESVDRGSTHASSRRGRIVTVTTDQKRFYRVNFLPMEFQVTCRMVSNDYGDVLRIANAVQFARRLGWLKFSVAYGGNSFDISVLPDTTIVFPESTGDSDTAKEYELEFNITVHGYISYPDLLEGQVIDTLQEVVQLVPLQEDGAPDASVLWKIPSLAERTDSILFTDLPANMR